MKKVSGSGRKKGTPNKSTGKIKELSLEYAEVAIKKLAHLMIHADSDAVKFNACREMLNRAAGKPKTMSDITLTDSSSTVPTLIIKTLEKEENH